MRLFLFLLFSFCPSASFYLLFFSSVCFSNSHFCLTLAVLPSSTRVRRGSFLLSHTLCVVSEKATSCFHRWLPFLRRWSIKYFHCSHAFAQWSGPAVLPPSASLQAFSTPTHPFQMQWCIYSPWAANVNPHWKVFICFGRKHVIHIRPLCLFSIEPLTCGLWQTLVLHMTWLACCSIMGLSSLDS